MNASKPANSRILQRLVADGQLTAEQQEAVLQTVQTTGDRIEDAILDLGFIQEQALLKYLAALHQTRFVSTDKLARADIDPPTLSMVPRKMAEHYGVFPVLFDAKTGTLSVVTADPDNEPALHEVQLASGAKQVRAFVSRPRAVTAAIGKAYRGDIHAFANMDRTAHEQFTSMLGTFERNLVSEESVTRSVAADEGRRERMLSAEDMARGGSASSGRGFSSEGYLETLNVLVSLVENSRPDLRGHSAFVARFMRKICERIGLSEAQMTAYIIAAYVHDLGKMGAYHLTSLNVSEYEGHRTQAQKTFRSPVRLLEAVNLPPEARTAVEHMYERYDGKGLPGEESGKDVPLGARLLAIADTYADLTQNPRNPFRKTLRPVQACEVLARYRGTIFDPNLVDLFKHTVTGDDLKARLLANRYKALLVDPDPEESTVLELRMIEQGFEVVQAHASDQAAKLLSAGDFQVVVSELDLKPQDGLALLAEARKHDWGKKLPWVVVTGRAGGADAKRAFELGAHDYMTKPVSAELLLAKIKQIMEREGGAAATRGVSGSLSEMGLPDMVQALWHGRKTGALRIRSRGDAGEIHFVEGMIFNALWGSSRGEEAFYAMLPLTEGDFALDPKFVAPQRVIEASPEALLLEGMRLFDERGR